MPIYEYLCINGHRHERLEPMADCGLQAAYEASHPPKRDCPVCGAEAFRQMAAANIAPDGAYSYKQGKREGA